MSELIYIILNIIFAGYLFWVALAKKFDAPKDRMNINGVIFCSAIVSLLNAACIICSHFDLAPISTVLGMLMFFFCAVVSSFLASILLIDPNFKNPIFRAIFDFVFVSFAAFVVFLSFESIYFDANFGYRIETRPLFDENSVLAKFDFRYLFYIVYVGFLPIASIVSCIINVSKTKDLKNHLKYGFYTAATFEGIFYIASTIGFALIPHEFNLYHTLFTYGFVVFAMILSVRIDPHVEFTKELLKRSLIDFVIIIFAESVVIALMFIFLLPLKDNKVLYFEIAFTAFFVILTFSIYLSYFRYERYFRQEDFKKMGYRISEENKILQYIQYYTETVESDKADLEYTIGTLNQTSDDILDFIKINANSYLVLFGNISNNTPEIRQNMLILKSVYRMIQKSCTTLEDFVQKVNFYIYKNISPKANVSMFFGHLDLKNDKLTFINCGMPLVADFISMETKTVSVKQSLLFLGKRAEIKLENAKKQIDLSTKDCVMICSDENANEFNIMESAFRYNEMKKSMLEIKYL